MKLTVPSGNHHLGVSGDQLFGGAAATFGQSVAGSLGLYNLKIKPGEAQFFYARLEPNPGGSYNFATLRRPSGRKC